MVKNNFQKVEKIVSGEQKFRSCVAFATPFGLLYGTDSQFELNTVRLLVKSNNLWISTALFSVNGPIIYGCHVGDCYFFSTSVEGDSLSKGKILKYFDKKEGPGVLEYESQIIGYRLDGSFNIIYKSKKDFLPFLLFQFGNILFPSGFNDSDFFVSLPSVVISLFVDLAALSSKAEPRDDVFDGSTECPAIIYLHVSFSSFFTKLVKSVTRL